MPDEHIDKPSRTKIPKFTSFKPPLEDAKPVSEERHDDDDKHTERDLRPSRLLQGSQAFSKSLREAGKTHSDDRHRIRLTPTESRKPNHGFLRKQTQYNDRSHFEIGHAQLYFTDKRGDRDNLSYGRPDRYSVPNYSRIGHSRILGLGKADKINYSLSNDRAIVVHDSSLSDYGHPRGLLTSVRGEEELRIISTPKEDETWHSENQYISLLPSDEDVYSETLGIPEDHRNVEYEPIVGHGAPHNEAFDELDSASNPIYRSTGKTTGINSTAQIRERNAYLSRMVKAEPHNLGAWIELAEHQEDLARLGQGSAKLRLTNSEQKALAEIRLSIYENALRVIGDDKKKTLDLLERIMIEGSKIWDTETILCRWQQYLELYNTAIGLWKLYLNFIQSSFSLFRLEQCRSIFIKCLRTLTEVKAKKDTENFRLYVILRFSVLARDAGYIELAIAIWQALLEFHIFKPTESDKSNQFNTITSSNIDSFEDFWESEVPRFGESGALGWKTYLQSKGDPPNPVISSIREPTDERDLFLSFAQEELLLSEKERLPGRSLDDFDDNDPYHVILFSDVRDFVDLSPAHVSTFAWIQAFLCFCTLPPLQCSRKTHDLDAWWQDTFLRTDRKRHNGGASPTPIISMRTTLVTLLSSSLTIDSQIIPIAWITNALASLSSAIPEDNIISQYYLAFVYQNCTEKFEQVAKELLSQKRTSVTLLLTYALIKNQEAESKGGEKVFKSILNVGHKLGTAEKENLPLFWQAWAWESLKCNDFGKAMQCALQICNSEPTTFKGLEKPAVQSQIDMGEQLLLDARSASILGDRISHAIILTECLAILRYLQNSENIDSALHCFRETSNLLAIHGLAGLAFDEVNHQSRADFLQWHMSTKKLFKPATARSILSESINLFPNNTKFLTLYFMNEARFRIDDRVRTIIHDTVLGSRNETIIGWQFAIWAEQNRGVEMGTTVHSVRATLEKAVGSESCRYSPILWQAYVLFECNLSELQRAKSVFLRGLTHLPWVKGYMMLAFTHLRSVMEFEELRNVYNVMGEKELRVKVDLSEIFHKHDAAKRREEIPS